MVEGDAAGRFESSTKAPADVERSPPATCLVHRAPRHLVHDGENAPPRIIRHSPATTHRLAGRHRPPRVKGPARRRWTQPRRDDSPWRTVSRTGSTRRDSSCVSIDASGGSLCRRLDRSVGRAGGGRSRPIAGAPRDGGDAVVTGGDRRFPRGCTERVPFLRRRHGGATACSTQKISRIIRVFKLLERFHTGVWPIWWVPWRR